jgi:hypothetical protein
VDTSALKWSRCFSEAVASGVALLDVERGSFDLPEHCIGFTSYARITAFTEGTASIRLRLGMQANAEFSGGIIFRSLAALNDSDYRSVAINPAGGSGAVFNPKAVFPVIYSPHVTVRLTTTTGAGGTSTFTYEVWAAALVCH